jgi:NitT/TauT family transport system permease protein
MEATHLPASLLRKQRRRRRERIQFVAIRLISLVIVLVAWQLYGQNQIRLLFAPISEVVVAWGDMLKNGTLLASTWYSLETYFTGLVIGATAGILLGILMARFAPIDAALGLYVYALYATPMVALIPLVTLWAGLTFKAQAIIVTLFVMWPVLVNTYSGVRQVDESLLEVGKSFRASEGQVWIHIILPSSIPYIMTGLTQAVATGLVGVIVGELLSALSGLGAELSFQANSFHTARVLAVVLTIMLLGVTFRTLINMLQRRITPWFRVNEGA